MIPCFLLPVLFVFLPSVADASVTIGIGPEAGVNTPIPVTWTRQEGDPRNFDLRFVTKDGWDLGIAAEIIAAVGSTTGTVNVTFKTQGPFVLKAIDYTDGDKVIATSPEVVVGPLPPKPSPPVTSTVSTTTPTSTTQSPTQTMFNDPRDDPSEPPTSTITDPSPSEEPSASSKTPAIVGGVIGGLVLLILIGIIITVYKRRRDSKTLRRLTFHRDMMVQHRPAPAPPPPPYTHDTDVESRGAVSPTIPPLAFMRSDMGTGEHVAAAGFAGVIPTITVATPPPSSLTPRQTLLAERTARLLEKIAEIQNEPYQLGMSRIVEQMRLEVDWLRAQHESPWARGITDVPPTDYELYMPA
ncbi:hypothetical protein Hypma_004443 [Hypsizygus marmoreus]|uniref:receptor protein-tyrosine kinase n=1 Tax=Hypsizygus marmoreus TaxID=39966 RepID=A0A369K009_HYPMA|nr:hypothetical protein Hypma_004443 [Hypsizygus marmoreus]